MCERKRLERHTNGGPACKTSLFLPLLLLLIGLLKSQQHATLSQRRIGSNKRTCFHTETEAADPSCYLTQSQSPYTEPTSPSADPFTPGAWQGSHWSASFKSFLTVCLLVGCLTSQQQASVSQGRICSDNFTCCRTEIEVADSTFYLTQSQYTDTGPTSPSADPITPGAWQGSQWSANFEVTGMTRPRKNPVSSGIRTRDLPLSRRTP